MSIRWHPLELLIKSRWLGVYVFVSARKVVLDIGWKLHAAEAYYQKRATCKIG